MTAADRVRAYIDSMHSRTNWSAPIADNRLQLTLADLDELVRRSDRLEQLESPSISAYEAGRRAAHAEIADASVRASKIAVGAAHLADLGYTP